MNIGDVVEVDTWCTHAGILNGLDGPWMPATVVEQHGDEFYLQMHHDKAGQMLAVRASDEARFWREAGALTAEYQALGAYSDGTLCGAGLGGG